MHCVLSIPNKWMEIERLDEGMKRNWCEMKNSKNSKIRWESKSDMATRMGTNHTVQMSRKQYVVLASQYDIQTHRILLIHHPPSTHTPTHPHHPHNTAQHTTSLHNTPSTISILPPILRGLSSNNISGGPTIALYYDSFHLHFPFQPLCLHILILTTRRLEWTGRGKPPLRVGRPWIRRRYFIPIRIDGV